MPSFDYTSRDYLSIRQDILNRAAAQIPEWTSRDRSDFGVVLVDLWAYMGDILHYYVDRAAAEAYLQTATQKSSVLAIANLLDYRPTFQTSAVGTVTIKANNPNHSDTITIPKNTGFIAPATDNNPIVYFTSTASASMGASVTSVSVPVAEGRYVNLESPVNTLSRVAGVSNGRVNQRFNLRYTGAIASSVEVYVYEGTVVDGEPTAIQYSYISNLSNVASNVRSYTLETTSDGIMQVVFGDGVNGKIPNNNAKVQVSYRYGQGIIGNIESGRILSYAAGSTVTDTNIFDSSMTYGGADSESITSMKANIPLMFRTQDRAVSIQDFKDLALRAPQVAKSTCDVSAAPNIMVYVCPYTPDYENYTSTQIAVPSAMQTGVIEYFAPRQLVGASVGVYPLIDLSPVDISVTIHVNNQYVAQWVKDAVETVIDQFFTFDSVSFGQILSIGDFYKALHNVEGVDYVTIDRFRFAGNPDAINATLTVNSLKLPRKGTVSLTTVGGVAGYVV